jgi:NitT/TauT family transport system ATP-binding protein
VSNDQSACVPGPINGRAVILEELLSIDKITKGYPMNDGTSLLVLKDLSLTINNIEDKPQILSLLGPSGVGKTTLLRIIAGLESSTSGHIRLSKDGKLCDVQVGDIGVVFQRYPLFDDLTVIQNLTVPATRSGMSAKDAQEKALQYLEEFNMIKQKEAWPLQLSGGQRQRVAIMQQLMRDRHFIILDEPFSGLDPINITNVINLITRTANKHTLNTFIIITHDITSALTISDHVYLMGRDRDEKGAPIPGARIVKTYDLIEEGIAYHTNVEDLPRFAEIRKEIKIIEFPKL